MKRLITIFIILCFFSIKAQVPYELTASSESFSPLTDASAFTWNISNADDDYSVATNIFDGTASFNYCGTTFTQFQVSTNGFIKFGNSLASAVPSDNLKGDLRGIVAPLWNDLAVGNQVTDITYKLAGTPGNYVMTIEWNNVKWSKTAATANAQFQVRLYQSNGNIEFIYGTMSSPTSGSASIGLVDNTVIVTTTQSTGRYLSINVGGSSGSRVFHQSMGFPYDGIASSPDNNTKLLFARVTPAPMAGAFTIGGTTPSYNTLSQAAMALYIHGVSGPVTFTLRDGVYDDIFHLINVDGTSSTNTITLIGEVITATLSPRNGIHTTSAPSATSGDHIIRLDGTQFCTISNISVIDNELNTTTATKYEAGIGLYNSFIGTSSIQYSGAKFNMIDNVVIDMKVTTGAFNSGSTGIRIGTVGSSVTDTLYANSYNTMRNFTIKNIFSSGVKMYGHSGTNPDRSNKVTTSGGTRNAIYNTVTVASNARDIRVFEINAARDLVVENTDIYDIINNSTAITTQRIIGFWGNPSAGVDFLSGSIILRNNKMYGLELVGGPSTTTAGVYGLSIARMQTGSSILIESNQIYDLVSVSPQSITRGIEISPGTSVEITSISATIKNNMVSDLHAQNSTTTPSVQGISVNGTHVNNALTCSVYNNSVRLNNNLPPLVSGTNVAHSSAALWWGNFGNASSSLDLGNNILINTMGNSNTGTGTSRATVIYTGSNANLLKLATTSDWNCYYVDAITNTGTSRRIVAYDGTITDLSTLSLLKSSASYAPRDVNSVSKAVNFVSATDLHLTGASLGDNDLIGTVLGSVTTDIDGHTRNAYYPYKGADENTATVLPRTNFTVPMTAGISNAAAFGSTGKVGSDGAGVDFYAHWDATYLYLGWTGGKTNYSSDLYYAAIDTDPDGTNGSTNAIEGVSFQTGAAKPDYYVVFENNSAFYGVPVTDGNAIEFYNVSGGAWNWVSRTGGNDNTASRVSFTDASGEVRLRIPWTSLGSITPGAGQKLGITMWNNNATANYMWARLPNENPANGATPKVLSHQMLFNSTASGLSPLAAWSSGLLPVELSSLNAAVSGTSVTLKWTTATEVNSYQFQIEQRSLDTEWSTVSSVQASGNSNSPKNYQYTVRSLTSGKYEFRLKMIDADGSFEYSEPVAVEISTPMEFILSQNYPNPFNPTTTLNYALPFQGNVQLLVYSINGELVKTLVSEVQAAGSYSVTFDASQLASGTYIYRLIATDATGKNFTDTKKMLLMK